MKKNTSTEPAMYQEIRRHWKIKRNDAQRFQDEYTKLAKAEGVPESSRVLFRRMAVNWQNVASEMSLNLEKFKVKNHGTKVNSTQQETKEVVPEDKELDDLIQVLESEIEGPLECLQRDRLYQ